MSGDTIDLTLWTSQTSEPWSGDGRGCAGAPGCQNPVTVKATRVGERFTTVLGLCADCARLGTKPASEKRARRSKPFYHTSEFWTVTAAIALPVLFPDRVDAITAALAAAGYAVSRGMTKQGTGDKK